MNENGTGWQRWWKRHVVLVLAKFTRRESEQRIFCLGAGSVPLNSELSEIGLELFGRLEDDSRHPEALSGFHVGGNIVNINGFLGPDLAGLEAFPVDDGASLARATPMGIDTNGKEPVKGKAGRLLA